MTIYLRKEQKFSLHESVVTEQFDLGISGTMYLGYGDVGWDVKNDIFSRIVNKKLVVTATSA
jgi:hypothetical protein